MSRQEAATVYLDVLLGFRGDYRTYAEASDVLSAGDKELLQEAVSCWPERRSVCTANDVFLTFN
jgi:hypothetical protein